MRCGSLRPGLRINLEKLSKQEKQGKKGQSSIEFIILISFVVLFFVVMLEIINTRTGELMREKEDILLEDLALSIQREIDLAERSSDGYVREFTLPEKLQRKNYYMTIQGKILYVNSSRSGVTLYIPLVQGELEKGTNIIRKNEGIIYINTQE